MEIIHFFAAFLRSAREDYMSFSAGLRCNALHDAGGRIGFGRQNKKHFIVLMVEFAERGEISFQPGFDSLAWAQHRGSG